MIPYPQTFKDAPNPGFTLVEMMVAIAIFAVVMTVSLSGLMTVINASQDERARSDAVDNLNFVIDDMIRRMRVAYDFDCEGSGDCQNGGDELTFFVSRVDEDPGNDPEYGYRLQGDYLERLEGGSWTRITPDSIDITSLEFFVVGTGSLDNEQTRVMIAMTGEVAGANDAERFSLNTTISQRLLFQPSG